MTLHLKVSIHYESDAIPNEKQKKLTIALFQNEERNISHFKLKIKLLILS